MCLAIAESTKPLSVLVGNRIKKILRERDVTFCYIDSGHNPADLATRGLTFSEMKESSLWWNGLLWYGQDPSVWPTWNTSEKRWNKFTVKQEDQRHQLRWLQWLELIRASRIQLLCLHWTRYVLLWENYYVFQCMCSSSSKLSDEYWFTTEVLEVQIVGN